VELSNFVRAATERPTWSHSVPQKAGLLSHGVEKFEGFLSELALQLAWANTGL